MSCRICGSADLDEPVSLREMMFGTRERFDYVRCRACDTLQILDVPDDMSRHYPPSYYSFDNKPPSLRDRIRAFIRKSPLPDWLNAVPGVSKNTSILDVGCGGGADLVRLQRRGFRRLRGYDPFISETIRHPGGIVITNTLPEERFELVTMHHSLEHVPDPAAALEQAKAQTSDGGHVAIRIPVRQGSPWREYGLNWAHLDPPRHFYLFTVEGFTSFARRCGLDVVASGFDSTMFSLAGSELFKRDIPLFDETGRSNIDQIFTEPERDRMIQQAAQLNEAGDGDSAWFILRPQAPTAVM